MKIKIQTEHYGTPEVEGETTCIPELFVTPAFYGEFGFSSDDDFVLTHAPTGIKVGAVNSKSECHRLAGLFSEAGIPWSDLKSPDDAKPFKDRYRAVMIKFDAGVEI